MPTQQLQPQKHNYGNGAPLCPPANVTSDARVVSILHYAVPQRVLRQFLIILTTSRRLWCFLRRLVSFKFVLGTAVKNSDTQTPTVNHNHDQSQDVSSTVSRLD